jgi:hypothetical protein
MNMSKKSFYQTWNLVNEAGPPPPPGGAGGPGGDLGGDLGGGGAPPGGDPMGGLGGGGPPGGDPMGGGEGGPQGEPIPIQSIPVADVWKILDMISKEKKYSKFFEEINVRKQKKSEIFQKKEKKTSLLK